MSSKKTIHLILAALMLALAMILPMITGCIPQIGNMLCPMHIPVLLCGFFCGPCYGAVVGAVAPLLRFALFGMPPIYPTGAAMCFELAVYGLVSGLLYRLLPKKKSSIYAALLAAMLCGRVIWGLVRMVMYGIGGAAFGWQAFVAGAFLNAVPGIILQIVLIPVLVMALNRAFPETKDKRF